VTITARAPERAFPFYGRGTNREDVLRSFRVGLRHLTNPDTGVAFTEREIQTATSDLTRWWMEADAIDLILLSGQARSLWLADQMRIDRASSSWLVGYHGEQWGEAPLDAVGGSGPADALAPVGTLFRGSTVLPDPTACQCVDAAGNSYQVLYTVISALVGGTAKALVTLRALDTGTDTNIPSGTELSWTLNKPALAAEKLTTTADFTGGTPVETMAQFAKRLLDRIRHKPAAGNRSHFRLWTRAASSAVEDAFIYPCAMHAGTVIVVPTQKRSTSSGPTARVPSSGTLADVTTYLVPPASPVVPTPPLVLVVAGTTQSADLVLGLGMPIGQSSGWTDISPWPTLGAGITRYTSITAVTDQTHFQITRGTTSEDLPAGVTAPSMMVFDHATSRYEKLDVLSVILSAGDVFDVVLNAAPAVTLATGQWVSPDAGRRELLAETIEAYFDSLGPGEVVDLDADTRAHRAYRFPETSEDWPQRAGEAVTGWLHDALGAALADSNLETISATLPAVPADPADGPERLVLGKVGVYPL